MALAPGLTYAGHWEPRIEIPFTDYYWGLPESWQAGHLHDESAHGEHCHGESSCAGKPTTVGATVAALNEAIALLGMAGLLVLLLAPVRGVRLQPQGAPDTPPPRALRLA
jgi:hypothetical protein